MNRCSAGSVVLLLVGGLVGCGERTEPRRDEAPTVATAALPEQREPGVPLAITVDDLPWIGALPPGETRVEATRELLAALLEHEAPATGFVNCGRVESGAPILRLWLDAGMELGNHTEQHLDLNRAALDAWLADVRSCDATLREITGDSVLFFRYPYLHEGRTRDRWAAARALLDELDSPVAHVTIDTADWILAAAYGDAIRAGESERAAEIGEAFLEHVVRVAEHYEAVAGERVGRSVAHVLLLHANALVSDYLDPLLDRLEEEGFVFVPLEMAQRDPVYALPNDYFGPGGLSWLYRFVPAAPELAAWDDREAARLRELFPR